MRPSFGATSTAPVDDEDETQQVIDAAANGDFIDVDAIVGPEPVPKRVSFTSVNRPAAHATPLRHDKPPKSALASTSNQKRQSMDEENRLAKLRALEMVTGDIGASKQTRQRGAKPTGELSVWLKY